MKHVVISGATSGIGKAIYEDLLRSGYALSPVVRKEEQLTAFPERKSEIVCDFSQPDSVYKSFDGFREKVDAFINCAGIMVSKTIFETSYEDMQAVMNVNLLSVMAAVGRIKQHLNPGGVILLLGSQSAVKGSYDDSYAISKAAIQDLTRLVATKMAPEHRIICLSPGVCLETRMTVNRSRDDLEPYREKIPLKRFTTPSEVAALAKFLISEPCSYMTGNTIDVNGGNALR